MSVHLRQLRSPHPLDQWDAVLWADCPECSDTLYGYASGAEQWMGVDDSLVCIECGRVCRLAVVVDLEEHLAPAALAGLRRILRLADPTWPDPWAPR